MTVSPELLAAYADGELDAETARTVEAEIAGDEQLQADLATHRALRARLSAHFAPIAEQPIPERLRQMVLRADQTTSSIIDFAAQAERRRTPIWPARWARYVGPALAATLVLAFIGFGLRPKGNSYAEGDLAKALDRQFVATQPADAPVRVLLTFQDKQGQYCRGFSGQASSGIACRDERGWRLIKMLDGAKGSSTEYRQAGGANMAIMTAAQAMTAGDALDAGQEAQAAQQGWRSRRPR
ncbi:anti-sigma factor [Novosphingobium colocasiae]|uniref:anti-sigma factor n=1 Tax=Novosphingobium colocasiae TaxID=1256513 RepID=UPI0035B0A59F